MLPFPSYDHPSPHAVGKDVGIYPWWIEQHEQPDVLVRVLKKGPHKGEELQIEKRTFEKKHMYIQTSFLPILWVTQVDDSNVILLGKSVVSRRQEIPATLFPERVFEEGARPELKANITQCVLNGAQWLTPHTLSITRNDPGGSLTL